MRSVAYGVSGLLCLIGLAAIGGGEGFGGLALTILGVGIVLAFNQMGNQALEGAFTREKDAPRPGAGPKYQTFEYDVPAVVHIAVRARSEKQAKRLLRESMEIDELEDGVSIAGVTFPEEEEKKK